MLSGKAPVDATAGTVTVSDPLGPAHRATVRRTVLDIITFAESDPLPHIDRVVADVDGSRERADLRSPLIEKPNGLHESSAARSGPTLEALHRWREAQVTRPGAQST